MTFELTKSDLIPKKIKKQIANVLIWRLPCFKAQMNANNAIINKIGPVVLKVINPPAAAKFTMLENTKTTTDNNRALTVEILDCEKVANKTNTKNIAPPSKELNLMRNNALREKDNISMSF